MTDTRADRLLAELAERYALTDTFRRQVRPCVVTILSDQIAEDDRVRLLEELAETCQRDQQLRAATATIRASLDSISRSLQEIVRRLRGPR